MANMKKTVLFALCLIFSLTACDTTPKAKRTYELSPEGLFSASLSEHYALTGNVQGSAQLWQLKPKKLMHNWQHTDEKEGILYSAIADAEQYALTAEKDSLAWWRIADGVLMNVWYLPNIHSVTLSADGQFALIGLAEKAIYYSLIHGKTLYEFPHDGAVTHVDISADSQLALTGSSDATAKLWDLSTGKLKYTWQHRSKLASLLISPDSRYALTNSGLSSIRLWNTQTGKLYKQLPPKLITLSSVTFSANGKYLVTGRVAQRIDLWNIKTRKIIKYWRPKKTRKWSPAAATILALHFAENDRKIYSIASNGYLQLWRK